MTQIAVIGRAIVVCVALGPVSSATTGQVPAEKPLKVRVCALQADPPAYNHKLIQVSGVVSHGFERFTLSDARCAQRSGAWLEIQSGGDVVVRATLLGRYFSGSQQHSAAGDFWGGYGHLGCCSLLAIQRVLDR